jgi:hypothetical protein
MAIIKKLKRLGSTIRGAKKDEIATFDEDGNIVGSNRYGKYVPIAPGSTNVGKVWTAKTNASAGWDTPRYVPEITEGDEGKILEANDQGDAQWNLLSVDVLNKFIANEDITVLAMIAVKIGRLVTITVSLKNNTESAIAANTTLFSVDNSIKPVVVTTGSVTGVSNIYAHPTNSRIYSSNQIAAGTSIYFSITYIVE